ncbi:MULTISPECIES: metallophosphoesterase [Pseudoalteromonas]|uniref:3',5'-cyclic-nucleotide phosphodiesterase n=1 Tax=Pseudoalteromonas amylolytica TaxID=1859457 RepID=A0A1S1N071_9GAMM|nr:MULTISPECIES: metallophosphoesterase [Pseudoalteromonas]OHU90630.1 3',5'-cyclic-nucleotide phosphodiesterase [Pseudoalteromonas sp. JW3]OHU92749.1 3',5'-cyclic-nucleotide phosphodiesterase [Pseudoalteromonas amylolytica]
MAWFDDTHHFKKSRIKLAHITDSHLFADPQGQYFDINTAEYLKQVLQQLTQYEIDGVIFGGDLTQDHSVASYELFSLLVKRSGLSCPVFWVPGNHDEIQMLEQMSRGQISAAKRLCTNNLDILLLDTKGETPAGWCEAQHLKDTEAVIKSSEHKTIAFCHHHSIPINGYLDKHILENGPQLLNTLVNTGDVLAVFHGHVHNEYHSQFRGLDVYATPATSVQFTKHVSDWQQQDLGPAWRLVCIDGQNYDTEVVWLNE